MLRFLYLAGLGYLGICLAALAFRPAAPLSHPGGRLAVAPGRGDAGAWFAAIKPFCNSVEVETAQQRNPLHRAPTVRATAPPVTPWPAASIRPAP